MFDQLYQLTNDGQTLFHFGSYKFTNGGQNTAIQRAEAMSAHDPINYPLENWVFSTERLDNVSGLRSTVESEMLRRAQWALDPIVKVIVRKYTGKRNEHTGPIALFPESCASCNGGYLCDSYEHVGQHGAADYNCVLSQTRPATPDEYADLKAELEAAPYYYKLEVRTRKSTQMHNAFLAERQRILKQS